MYCSNCGAEAGGNFCSKCGAPLKDFSAPSPSAGQDWSQEIRYENLIRISEIRDLVAKNAAMAKRRLSVEQFLGLADKVIPWVPLEVVTLHVFRPLYVRLGMKTGKRLSETMSSPPGAVIVAALCSLARRGQSLQQVRQSEDGCLLEATLPSDVWSHEGTLYVSVQRTTTGTRLDCATNIKGQLFDWGKSKRCLKTIFADIKTASV